MPVELLIHATDHVKALKGTIQDARNVDSLISHPWGGKEGSPNYVRIRVIDAVKADIDIYLQPIKNTFTFSLVQDLGTSRIYGITVNPAIISLFGMKRGVTLETLVMLSSEYSVTLVSRELDNRKLVLNILNTDWTKMINEVSDVFEEVLSARRYYLTTAVVDQAIKSDDLIEMKFVEIVPKIFDRLA